MKNADRQRIMIGIGVFLIPALILSFIFFTRNVVPFGNNSLIVDDFNNQYVGYFAYLHNHFSTMADCKK